MDFKTRAHCLVIYIIDNNFKINIIKEPQVVHHSGGGVRINCQHGF